MNALIVTVALWLAACTAGQGAATAEETDMRVLRPNPAQTGQTKTFKAPWTQGEIRALFTKDPESRLAGQPPITKNLTLGLVTPASDPGFYVFRWQVEWGVGGGRARALIDAQGLTQLSMSADSLRVALMLDDLFAPESPLKPSVFSPPAGDVFGTAFMSETATDTDAPTYTQRVVQDTATTVALPVPAFASGVRILGQPSTGAQSPFQATATFSLLTESGLVFDVYQGALLEPLRLQTIATGIAARLSVTNATGAQIAYAAQWQLDL